MPVALYAAMYVYAGVGNVLTQTSFQGYIYIYFFFIIIDFDLVY